MDKSNANGQDWGALTTLPLTSPGAGTTNRNQLFIFMWLSKFSWKIWGENEAIIEKHGKDTVYRTDNEQIQFCIGWWNADMDIGYE